jgi:CO/xanthine dehydrogenase FAD-binding subunit
MKAAAFEYVRVASVEETCRVLAAADGVAEHKIIAGGQTLVPLMAMRLARPTLLIDINDVAELTGISRDGSHLVIRACTRQREAETDPLVAESAPLLAKALPFVGHRQTRNRGTVGGSIVHGDPSAEIALVALMLDAILRIQGPAGDTHRAIDGFFEAPMMTALAPDECLVDVRFPEWGGTGSVGTGFHEVASRTGDFAIVAAAAQVALDGNGVCRRAALGVGGVGPTPIRLAAAEEALVGTRLDDAAIDAAAALIDDAIEPDSDLHATEGYRRRVSGTLIQRAVRDAAAEASA